MDGVNYPKSRWFVLVLSVIVTGITAMALISPAPLIGAIQKTMSDLSLGQVTYVAMFYFNFFVAFSALFGGILLDRFGIVKVYIGGMILITAGSLLVPFIGTSYSGMFLLRLLQGCGTGPIMAAGAYIAATYFPRDERSIATGAVGVATSGGLLVGFIYFPRIFAATGNWQTAMTWLAPISVLGIVFSIIIGFIPKPSDTIEAAPDVSNNNELKAALHIPVTWIAIGCVFLLSWIYQAFMDLIPNYLGYAPPIGLGKGEVAAGQAMSCVQLLFMVGAMTSGIITDKVFKSNGRPMLLTGFLAGGFFGLLIKFPFITGNNTLLITCLVLAGFFYAFVVPQAIGFLARNYPKNITGKLGGLAWGIGIFGGAAGVAAGARALHVTGLYQMSINIMVSICVVGFFVGLFLRKKKETGESKA